MRTVGPALLTAALVLGAAACGSSTTTIPTGNGGSVTLNNDGTSGWKAQIKGTGSAKECSANAISKLEGKGFTKREEVNLGGASQAALTSSAYSVEVTATDTSPGCLVTYTVASGGATPTP
jgi:hypothetical protein